MTVRFWDRVTHGGEALEPRCEQRMHGAPGGLIDLIEHHDLPGERERLSEFRSRHGL